MIVKFEQAVYGSFAFRDRGYAVLAQSPGCRETWLADFRAACQAIGERPSGAAEAPGLFAVRLPSGPWAVVGMSPQGRDDRGRPGALAFHALFVSPRDYRKLGGNPFALAAALRSDWDDATTLTAANWTVPPDPVPVEPDPRAEPIALALRRRGRVVLESAEPIDGLARAVWGLLPPRVRLRKSVATLAFGDGNRFDLAAVPRLAALPPDRTRVDPFAEPARPAYWSVGARIAGLGVGRVLTRLLGEPYRNRAGSGPGLRNSPALIASLALALGAVGVVLAVRGTREGEPTTRAEPPAASFPPEVPPSPGDDDPAELRRVAEVLEDLADGAGLPAVPGEPGPAALMERVSVGLRYRGPWLSSAERGALAADPGRDAAEALAWDARVRAFADDRPLPPEFRRGRVRRQLAALAWSYHLDGFDAGPRRTPSELAQALAGAVSAGGPRRPSPLAGRYPELSSYFNFLARFRRR